MVAHTKANDGESNDEQEAELESVADGHYGWKYIPPKQSVGGYCAAWEYHYGDALIAVEAIDDHGVEDYEVYLCDRSGETDVLVRHSRTITLTEAGAYADQWMGAGEF